MNGFPNKRDFKIAGIGLAMGNLITINKYGITSAEDIPSLTPCTANLVVMNTNQRTAPAKAGMIPE